MKMRLLFIAILLTLLASCGRATQVPTNGPTSPQTTETATLVKDTPEPTPSVTATQQEATPTQLPTEVRGLNPEGPFILYGGKDAIWISNTNGEQLTQIFSGIYRNDLRTAVSPDGKHLAVVIKDSSGYKLIVIEIPSGQQIKTIQLLDGFAKEIDDPKIIIEQVLTRHNVIAWQAKVGRFLAFVAAFDSPTTDLFLLDTRDQKIIQMTDDPSYAIAPTWSEDGKYIINYRVQWERPFDDLKDITDYDQLQGIWAVNSSNRDLLELPVPEVIHPVLIGWFQKQHILSCEDGLIKSIDIKTGWESTIINCCCDQVSLSSRSGSLLLNITNECNQNLQKGVYYLANPFAEPTKVVDQPASELIWLPESEAWFAYPEALIAENGRKIYTPPIYDASYLPTLSINGSQAWLVYEEEQPLVKVLVPGGEWETILRNHVKILLWDPRNPRRLLIVSEEGRLMAAEPPNFIPEEIGFFKASVDQAIYIPKN